MKLWWGAGLGLMLAAACGSGSKGTGRAAEMDADSPADSTSGDGKQMASGVADAAIVSVLDGAVDAPAPAERPAMDAASADTGPEPGVQFYVSRKGNDAWSGTLPDPNPQKTDGPFATVERAREALRQYKASHAYPAGGLAVNLRAGVYPINATFSLGPMDSGKPNAPVVWRAYGDEIVRLMAGTIINNFLPVTDAGIIARLPAASRASVKVANVAALGLTSFPTIDRSGLHMALYQGASAIQIARYPNDGWLLTDSVPLDCTPRLPGDTRTMKPDGTSDGMHCGRLGYADARPSLWAASPDKFMDGYWYWDWAADSQPVTSIDAAKKEIVIAAPYHYYGYRAGQRFIYQNIFEEIDTPGEWYLDRAARLLYFWPVEAITADNVFLGTKSFVMWSLGQTTDVELRNLIFEGSGEAAITITDGARNTIDGCTIRHMQATWSVEIKGGTFNGCARSTFNHLASSALKLEGGDRKALTRGDNYAVGNHIYDFSRIRRSDFGLSVTGVGNRVANNRFHEGPSSAIYWGGNDLVIEYNEIFNMVLEANDAGAIYAGRNPSFQGNILRHNYLHDIGKIIGHGSAAIYLDDGVSGTSIVGNVFVNAGIPGSSSFGAVFSNGGRYNTVENNLFVDTQNAFSDSQWAAATWSAYWLAEPQRTTLYTDVHLDAPPYSDRYPWLKDFLSDARANSLTCNLAYRCDKLIGRGVPMMANNLVTTRDPGFVDAAAGNFALRADSWVPAQLPCWKAIPFEKIGPAGLR